MQNTTSKHSLWQFIDDQAGFRVQHPDALSRLYFPLANEAGILSSITPDLHGDIKTNHDSFLTLPVTIEDLHDSKSSRNFWVYVEGKGAWSLTGMSASQHAAKFLRKPKEKVTLDAGMLWHKITRENEDWGLKAEITNFAPVSNDTLEIMIVTLTNTSSSRIKVTPTSAIPIFGRSADNLRDHHHVTSLLHRIVSHPAGVILKPTMSFDERGHKINETIYAVLGATAGGEFPVGSFFTTLSFIGEGGHLEAPQAILENAPPPQKDGASYHGKSAIGALRFKTTALASREKISFVLMLGIATREHQIE
ncbi:MAG: cellobiose phosphorylase, partial [Candidatus Omnitrophica bacterium]|nr:cellobiose phosphorylase [Candidatus Omnitrophota bacterium]